MLSVEIRNNEYELFSNLARCLWLAALLVRILGIYSDPNQLIFHE